MRSVNKVILIGNVTRDPELKNTPNGQAIATFGVATNREWTTSEKERKSLAEFHSVVVWGKLAELCSDAIKKGRLVYVEGYLKTRSWDNESGTKSFRTEIVAEDVIFLDKSRKGKDEEGTAGGEDSHDEMSPSSEQDVVSSTSPETSDLDNLF